MGRSSEQRVFDARRWQTARVRGLAHPAIPDDELGLWHIVCERPACRDVFVTKSKQRRYCSESCRRLVEQQRARTVDYQSQQLTEVCAAEGCRAPFVRSRVNHLYCSAVCGQRARRARARCTLPTCLSCDKGMPDRTVRARYCSPACRVRAARARAAAAAANNDTELPPPVQRNPVREEPDHAFGDC